MKLSILLATYNSSKFIEQQLDSIINQTFQQWNLYIRDDGSIDNTIQIIEKYILKDKRIVLLKNEQKKLGAAKGFMYLLESVSSDYYMFCDHDDVWLPNKIQMTLDKMRAVELKANIPIVVHTDLVVVDKDLQIVNKSYWKAVGLKPSIITKGEMIQVFNCVTGCTMMLNEKAKEVSLPYNTNAPMHDWWIAMQVVRYGGIACQVNEPLIYYRQHGNNEVGAKAVNLNYYLGKIKNMNKTFQNNLERIAFLKEISGIGPLKFFFYKIYYNLIRKF